MTKSEDVRWDAKYTGGGYAIIPFTQGYWGLYTYMKFPENPEWAIAHSGYLDIKGDHIKLGAVAAALNGLPQEAQFQSAEQAKELVSETCNEKLTWEGTVLY